MVGVGIVVLLLVREAPTATYGAEADRKQRARPTRDELRDILAGPNAKVLIGGSLLFWSGVGSTAYVAILFFQRVLHAGASAQTIAGLVTGVPVFFIGIALGIPLSRKLTPMQLAIGAPLVGAVLAGVQYFDTHLWQAVVLSYIGAPFIGAYLIVMAPLLLQLLPRAGGLGERLGVLLAPFNLCSVVLAYIAAIVIDATGNYRLIWLFPAATGLAHATVNCWLKYPARQADQPRHGQAPLGVERRPGRVDGRDRHRDRAAGRPAARRGHQGGRRQRGGHRHGPQHPGQSLRPDRAGPGINRHWARRNAGSVVPGRGSDPRGHRGPPGRRRPTTTTGRTATRSPAGRLLGRRCLRARRL